MTIIHGKGYGKPTLDLNFAGNKSLIDTITRTNYVTFTRAQSGNEATYVGSDGLIKYASADEPRFDHDPETLESLGLLIEEQRTNLVGNSTSVTATGGTVTLNGGSSPDGGTASILLTANQTGGYVQGNSGFTVSTVTDHTISFWYKDGTGTAISIRIEGVLEGGGKGFFAFNDLNDGTNVLKGSTHTDSYGIQVFSNGWKRFYMGYNSTSGTNNTGSFGVNIRIFGIQDTQTCYLFGLQTEAGSFPTSYIPTSGSTETRSADFASITGSNFSSWYNQSEGTVFCDVITRCPFGGGNTTSNIGVSFVLSDGTFNNITFVQRPAEGSARGDNFQPRITSSGSIVLNVEVTDAWPANLPNKQIIAYKVNDFNYSVNGVLGSPVTTGSVPSGIDRLDIGQVSFASYNRIKAGTFARLTYYPKRLPDIELQQLTK